MAQIDLEIRGMTCGHCVKHVREALAKMHGVKTIDVQIGHARIEASSDVTDAALAQAIADASYEVTRTTRT